MSPAKGAQAEAASASACLLQGASQWLPAPSASGLGGDTMPGKSSEERKNKIPRSEGGFCGGCE